MSFIIIFLMFPASRPLEHFPLLIRQCETASILYTREYREVIYKPSILYMFDSVLFHSLIFCCLKWFGWYMGWQLLLSAIHSCNISILKLNRNSNKNIRFFFHSFSFLQTRILKHKYNKCTSAIEVFLVFVF